MAKPKGQYSLHEETDFDPNDLEAIHSQAMVRFTKAFDYAEDEREKVREDHCFCDEEGGQWGQRGRNGRRDNKRPRLEINEIRHIRNTVVGEYRENRFVAKVRPAGGESSQKLADLHNGIIRNQLNNSIAQNAADNALQELATGGIGALELSSEYSNDTVSGIDAFDQEIVIRTIHDAANSVFFDPDSTDDNHRDADYAFNINEITPMAFRAKWPDSQAGDFGLRGVNGPCKGWRTNDFIRVANYYVKEWYDTKVYMFDNGQEQKVYEESNLVREEEDEFGNKITVDVRDELAEMGYKESRSKKVELCRVWRYKLSGSEVLQGPNLWKGRFIPLIVGYGYNGRIDGEHWYHGVVRPAKDPQRFHNYVVSAIAERCGKSVKDFYWGTDVQAANNGAVYRKANIEDRFMMPYTPDPEAPGPPIPSRQATMDPNLLVMLEHSRSGIQKTTGFSDAALGSTQERSGVAIERQTSQSQKGLFILKDNFAKMMEHLAEQMIDVNPRILDKQRQVRVMEEDGKTEIVLINEVVVDRQTDKEVLLNDLSQGKYDLVRDTGPSFGTKREEAVAFFQNILQTNPMLAQVMMPLMIKSMDIPYGDKLEEVVDWLALKEGWRPPTEEEQEAQKNKPRPIDQVLAEENLRAELELKVAKIDEMEIGNEKTRSETAENWSQVQQNLSDVESRTIQSDAAAAQAVVQVENTIADKVRADAKERREAAQQAAPQGQPANG